MPREPFGGDDPQEFTPKAGLKSVSGQKSIFDGKKKPPSQQEFQQKIHGAQEKSSGYKQTASQLFIRFLKSIADKTLTQNKNIFSSEKEQETLQELIQLGMDVNNDPLEENNGMGSLTLITLLFKTCLAQRDKINDLEYAVSVLQKKTDLTVLNDLINKELSKSLDSKKTSE